MCYHVDFSLESVKQKLTICIHLQYLAMSFGISPGCGAFVLIGRHLKFQRRHPAIIGAHCVNVTTSNTKAICSNHLMMTDPLKQE